MTRDVNKNSDQLEKNPYFNKDTFVELGEVIIATSIIRLIFGKISAHYTQHNQFPKIADFYHHNNSFVFALGQLIKNIARGGSSKTFSNASKTGTSAFRKKESEKTDDKETLKATLKDLACLAAIDASITGGFENKYNISQFIPKLPKEVYKKTL